MKYAVIINSWSGGGTDNVRLEQLTNAAVALPETRVHVLTPTDDVTALARNFVEEGVQAIAAAGGDGTIGSVANALVNTQCRLVPISFGTHNHFCSDAGIEPDAVRALEALDSPDAEEMTIDVGLVNGRYFLDNSSLGLYPHLVKSRLKRHEAIGKWPAYFLAAIQMVRHPVRMTVQTELVEEGVPVQVGLVFASNNVMDAEWPNPGRRERLDEGVLQVFVLKEGGVLSVLRSAAAFLRGNTKECPVLEERRVQSFQVKIARSRARVVRVSCDGEIHLAKSPIRFETVPKSLIIRKMRH